VRTSIPAPPSRPPAAELKRALGVNHAAAVVVGTVIGSGIFLVPSEMTRAVGSAQLVYAAWLLGGALSLFGALSYAELGALRPHAGGEYVFIRDGYGPLAGFITAWGWFLIAKPGSIASIATGMMLILGNFGQFAFMTRAAVSWPLAITWGQVVALGVVAFISLINYIGVEKSGELQLVLTIFKIAIVLAVVLLVFGAAQGTWSNFSTRFAGARGGTDGFMVALVAALWAYDGWNNVAMVAGEIKSPERNVPIALISGMIIVAALYMLMNAAVQFVMPAAQIAASDRPAVAAVRISMGAGAAGLFSAGVALQMLGTLNGTILSGARMPYAAARDGYFFKALGAVHPRFRTPGSAIIFQAAVAAAFVLLIGEFARLISVTIFAEWLFYMAATGTVFIFRRREPHAPRRYRTWGYPVVPALFMAASAVLLTYTFIENLSYPLFPSEWLTPPANSLSVAGALVLLAAVPVFYAFAARKER
jgi:APA family basic amino acid/polyamine antiporter